MQGVQNKDVVYYCPMPPKSSLSSSVVTSGASAEAPP